MPYRHCEYHWLVTVQVEPDSQVVPPVHPVPPHCPYLATVVPPVATLVVAVPADVVVPAAELADAATLAVDTVASPVGVSSERTQPDLFVMASGHATLWKLMVGLSAFWNQSQRQ